MDVLIRVLNKRMFNFEGYDFKWKDMIVSLLWLLFFIIFINVFIDLTIHFNK